MAESMIKYGKSYQQSIHFSALPLMWLCRGEQSI